MRPTRTNPAYAALAYRKAVIAEVIERLNGEYTSAMGDNPSRVIISDDVIREDSEVPEKDIGAFVEELQQEQESLRLQLLKFDFVRRDEQATKEVRKQQPKAAASPRVGAAKGSAGKRKK